MTLCVQSGQRNYINLFQQQNKSDFRNSKENKNILRSIYSGFYVLFQLVVLLINVSYTSLNIPHDSCWENLLMLVPWMHTALLLWSAEGSHAHVPSNNWEGKELMIFIKNAMPNLNTKHKESEPTWHLMKHRSL